MPATAPRTLTVALAGNPNSGKTTLFNHLTGSRQRVGNFSGVTVSRKEGVVEHRGWVINLIDLPGTYSLSSETPDELVSREYILHDCPDLILNVIDAGNLQRNLFLTTQLIEMDAPRVYALNMSDEARAAGQHTDLALFAELLDGPAVETVGRTGEGLSALLDAIVDSAGAPRRQICIAYDDHLERAINQVQARLQGLHQGEVGASEARWMAIKLLEGDAALHDQHAGYPELLRLVTESRTQVARQHGESVPMLLADGRYGFIHGLIAETVSTTHPPRQERRFDPTRLLDGILLNRVLGLPVLLGLLWLMFQATFVLGEYPMGWIDSGVGWLSGVASSLLPESLLRDLLVEGVIAGVGGVVIFLPNILLLFLFIALFETTGYMARAAFLMDRVMHSIGLHGKAFIPLLMGFGCNVPAIMATRTIENPRDRLLTILINPFMSCSARLPVYVLLGGIFFQEWAGTVVFGLHLLGVLVAMSAALLLKNTLFRGLADPFVMELPPYRLPTLRSITLHMWERAVQFLKKMGGIILVGSILIWFLQSFPRDIPPAPKQAQAPVAATAQGGAAPSAAEQEAIRAAQIQEQRYLGQIGKAIEPVFAPLGFDWKASVALLTGFVAKEVVVSTFGVLYHVGATDDPENPSLRAALGSAMSPVVALGFMVFTLLYMPCLATIAAIRRETGSWGWTLFSMGLGLTLAWLLAFVTVHLGRWLL